MTMPSSGTISMGQINNELGRATSAQIGLDGAENGSYGAIAPYSPTIPSTSNPAYMSKWYGYNGAAFPYFIKWFISSEQNCGYTTRLWQIGPGYDWTYVTDCYAPGCNSSALCGVMWSIPGGATRSWAFTNLGNSYIRWGSSLFDANACGYVNPNERCGKANPLGVGGISSNWNVGNVIGGCGNNTC